VTLLFSGLFLIGLGALAAWLLEGRSRASGALFQVLAVAGCALGGGAAVRVLLGTPAVQIRYHAQVLGGDWVWGLDALSAAFALAVFVVGAAAAVFGVAYLAAETRHRRVGASHAFVGLLIVAMALVVTARAAIPFLIAWEAMALSAYFLVVFDDTQAGVRRAGLIYLVATHTGTLALLALFALWGGRSGSFEFDRMMAADLSGALPSVLFGLALVGFGVKAGFVPLHFWLPEAHPAAPTHVSALMSGLMIKTGVYGLLRVITMLPGAVAPWWGWTLLLLGLASGVLGVLWAMVQHDLKRLLAYHSIENIGIILMGVGLGTLGMAYGRPPLAVLGFSAAVLHSVNHALFKSLLFFGAGAVARATGTREIERLGGLARRMPVTWIAFLIGSAAIVGLPPLNGFVGEWLLYNGLFSSALSPAATPVRFAVWGAAGLALIGALALACFAKVGGVVFLGHPRSPHGREAREVGPGFLAPMIALAILCVVMGLFPYAAVGLAWPAGALVAGLSPGSAAQIGFHAILGLRALWLFTLAIPAVAVLLWVLRALLLRRRAVARGPTWACGYAATTPRMQYTGSSFVAPLVAAYRGVVGLEVRRAPGSFTTEPIDRVLEHVLLPAWRAVLDVSARVRTLQHGRLNLYLVYMLVTLLALLVWLYAAGTGAGIRP